MIKPRKALSALKKGWGRPMPFCRGFLSKVILTAAMFLASSAHAEPPQGKQILTYEVYAGGIHAVQAEVVLDFTKPERYTAEVTAKTRGFLARLVPWEGAFKTEGRVISGPVFQPEIHQSWAIWRGERETSEYIYDPATGALSLYMTEHEKPRREETVDPALTTGTTDVLSATLAVQQSVANGAPCEGEADVFDGKRRFTQVFAPDAAEVLQKSKYNIYEGAASLCTVEIKPVTGEWHKKPRGWLSIQEQGRARGTMPTLWMARLDETGPAVPVKIRVKTAYGTLFMHLSHYENSAGITAIAENVDDY